MTTPDREQDGLFMRGAAVVGGLDSEFYDEERQREVWNEASAVGLQLTSLLGLGASAAMLWIVGRPAQPYALVLVLVVSIPSVVTMCYAHRLGVEIPGWAQLGRWRLLMAAVLGLLNVILWVSSTTSSFGGALAGLGVLVVAAVIAGGTAWRKRRVGP